MRGVQVWGERPACGAVLAVSVASFLVVPQLVHASQWLGFVDRVAIALAGCATGLAVAVLLVALASGLAEHGAGPGSPHLLCRFACPSLPLLLAWLELVPDDVPLATLAHGLAAPGTVLALSAAAALGVAASTAAAGATRLLRLAWHVGAALGLFVVTLLLPNPTHATPTFMLLGMTWGLYVLAAMAGWGTLVAKALFPDDEVGWALRAAWGMAAAVAVGGVLDVAWAVSRPAILALLAAGVVAAVSSAVTERARLAERLAGLRQALRADATLAVLAAVVLLLAALELAASVHGATNNVSAYHDFDLHDDYQGYLVFPEKMLQTGSLGAEPFDARRMITLGGQSFLQTLILAGQPLRALHLLDAGIALLILIGLLLGLARERQVPPRLTLLIAIAALLAPHVEARGNTSAVLTGTALLVACFRLLDGPLLERRRPWRNATAVALPAAALGAVKLTFLPVAALLLFLSYALAALRGERFAALTEAAAAALVSLVLLAPWMIALRAASGTFLYPLLGHGFYGGVTTNDFAAGAPHFAIPPFQRLDMLLDALVPTLPVLALAAFARDRSRRSPVLALALAVVGGGAAVALFQDPYLQRSIYRYLLPIVLAGVLALLTAALAPDPDGRREPVRVAAAMGIGLLTLQAALPLMREGLVQSVRNVAEGLSWAPIDYPDETREMRALQAAVPPGARFLARLPYPFTLDFRRNPVLVDPLPGMASPPPGLPTFAGGEPVARFLVAHSIRYLAYGSRSDPRRMLNLSEKDINDRYPRSRVRWIMFAYHRDFEASVMELAASRRHLCDNEQSFLLDLATWEVRPDAAPPGVEVSGVGDDGWTDGDARVTGLDWRLGPGRHELAVVLHGWHPWAGDPARLAPVLEANGRELPLARTTGNRLFFATPPDLTRIESLRLRSAVFAGDDVGTADGHRMRGLDLEAIRSGRGAQEEDPEPFPTVIAGPLLPEQVTDRKGFFDDNNWTDGDGVLSGFRLVVPAGHHHLALALGPAHPFRDDAERLDVRVVANGIPLVFDKASDAVLTFRLYRDVAHIDRLRILSSTFVPEELGIGDDQRHLGVPVESIATCP